MPDGDGPHCRWDRWGTTSDDKFGIMTTLGFQWSVRYLLEIYVWYVHVSQISIRDSTRVVGGFIHGRISILVLNGRFSRTVENNISRHLGDFEGFHSL